MSDELEYLQYLAQEEVVNDLWLKYKKTLEYKKGKNKAISQLHPLVRKKEEEGLKKVYRNLVDTLELNKDNFELLKNRTTQDWLDEWEMMHSHLFEGILKNRGKFRRKNVTFGNQYEDLYKIPDYREVPRELGILTQRIKESLNRKLENLDEICLILAQIHYQFIRIHPFFDGNGRIARVLTDQLSISFGLTPAMGGYPRHDIKERTIYHQAIRACAYDDPECKKLAEWIRGYIKQANKKIIG